MAHFTYRGKLANGEQSQGTLEAQSVDHAVDLLRRQGVIPLEIKEGKQRLKTRSSGTKQESPGLWAALTKAPIKSDDLILFCRQMYALSRSGIPLLRAMNGLAEATTNPSMADVLHEVGQDLSRGNPLATSLAKHNKTFNPLFISLIQMGETTGRLDTAFQQLVSILEMEKETEKRVKQATRYPSFVVIALLLAMLVINYAVIPQFSSIFDKLGSDLPLFTKILVNSSNFMRDYAVFLLAGLLLTVTAFVRYVRTEKGLLVKDRVLLKIPIIGPILQRIAMSRFTRPFAIMLDAGVPLLSALNVASRTVGNTWIGQSIVSMQRGIERGETLSATATKSAMFNALVLQMISVGEETGNLSELLIDVSDFYDQEVEYDLKKLSDRIEPILLVLMGSIVTVLALGVFLPMWDLADAAGL